MGNACSNRLGCHFELNVLNGQWRSAEFVWLPGVRATAVCACEPPFRSTHEGVGSVRADQRVLRCGEDDL